MTLSKEFDERGWLIDDDHLFCINIDKVIVRFKPNDTGLEGWLDEPKELHETDGGKELVLSASKSIIDALVKKYPELKRE